MTTYENKLTDFEFNDNLSNYAQELQLTDTIRIFYIENHYF